ncbi:T4-like virus tail tube protein gp19 [uncultured archaeon]|nr:T4-like virus tail tube protein gp19 [uncultured archaeon]
MADEKKPVNLPFTSFNFEILLSLENDNSVICQAAFSECDGLEMSMEIKTIKEGGNNAGPIHMIGPVSYGQLTLKRGMTDSFDLWDWFDKVRQRDKSGYYASGKVIMLSSDNKEQAAFVLKGCLPVKLKAPSLNAKEGMVAIEEMTIAYQSLNIMRPDK